MDQQECDLCKHYERDKPFKGFGKCLLHKIETMHSDGANCHSFDNSKPVPKKSDELEDLKKQLQANASEIATLRQRLAKLEEKFQ